MQIRRADKKDINDINNLLRQVLNVHHEIRSDIFKPNAKKYTDEELIDIINDDTKPIFVAISDEKVVGYAFCVSIRHIDNNILTDIKTLYIDDLCVDENMRGKNIGRLLYDYVVNYAKENDFYNITLNVWAQNEKALGFYEHLGMKKQKIFMEEIL